MTFYIRLFTIITGLVLSHNSYADSPPVAPMLTRECSLNGVYCIESDPEKNLTTITKKGAASPIGRISGWHRWMFISNEGNVVIGYDGVNLVPIDIKMTEPVFYFYKKDKLIKTIVLGYLYQRKSQMQPTVSHYAWIDDVRFDAKNHLQVKLIDGRKIIFDSNTGLPLKKS
jgi:hypothetical protein